jgi:hypothetical protein
VIVNVRPKRTGWVVGRGRIHHNLLDETESAFMPMPSVSKRLFEVVLAQRLRASDVSLATSYQIHPRPGQVPNWEIRTGDQVVANIARSLQMDFEINDPEFR